MKTKCGHPICGGIIMDEFKWNNDDFQNNIKDLLESKKSLWREKQ